MALKSNEERPDQHVHKWITTSLQQHRVTVKDFTILSVQNVDKTQRLKAPSLSEHQSRKFQGPVKYIMDKHLICQSFFSSFCKRSTHLSPRNPSSLVNLSFLDQAIGCSSFVHSWKIHLATYEKHFNLEFCNKIFVRLSSGIKLTFVW